MTINKSKKPHKLKKLEILISRLPQTFPKLQTIENDIKRLHKEYYFKQKVDNYLKRLPKKFSVFNDICLKNIKQFKIDSLIITSRAIFIVQLENITTARKLLSHVTQFNKQKILQYITKVRATQANLVQWLNKRELNLLPIHSLIVICQSTAHHIKTKNHMARKLTLAKHLPSRIINFYRQLKQRCRGNKQVMEQVEKAIVSEKETFNFDIFDHYGINKNIILTGVRCETCQKFSMKRVDNSWKCIRCGSELRLAHKEALRDYFTLLKRSICKRECQWFLNIKSQDTVVELLKEEKLIYNSKQKVWLKPL